MKMIDSEQPHRMLLATSPGTTAQRGLGDYEPAWPEIAHAPEEDVAVPQMDPRAINNKRSRIQEGTILTINTVIQAKVTDVDLDPDAIEEYYEELPNSFKRSIIRLSPLTPRLDTDLIVVFEGGYKAPVTYIPLEQSSCTSPVCIKDLRVHNEHNLPETIQTDVYERLKLYKGGQAIRLEKESGSLGHQLIVGTVDSIHDGKLYHTTSSSRNDKTISISTADISSPWFFLPGQTDAAHIRKLSATNSTGMTFTQDLPSPLHDALQQAKELPEGAYETTSQGVYATGLVSGSIKGVKLIEWDTAPPEFTSDDEPSLDEPITVPTGDAVAPDSPVSEITGIGTVTARKLSNLPSSALTTTSRASPTDHFFPLPKNIDLEAENWRNNDTIYEVPAKDIPPEVTGEADCDAPFVDYVRKVPDNELPQELIDAHKDYKPPESTSPASCEFITVKQFIDEGPDLTDISPQYLPNAIADLKASTTAYNDTYELSPADILLTLHAGATTGRLLAADGTELGKLPNLVVGNCSLDDIAGVEAWQPQTQHLQTLSSHSHPHFVLYRNDADAFPDGPLELDNRGTPWELTASSLDVTTADYVDDTITFHQDRSVGAESHPHVTIHETVAAYVSMLAGKDITNEPFICNYITMTTDDDLFITIPDTNLTFAIL